MKYLIAVAVVLSISFILGLVFGMVASDVDPVERARDDDEQLEYLRTWREKKRIRS